jgi:hypothetical protein
MMYVMGQALRWVSDEPFPGLVEVSSTDARGHRWTFIDESAVFGAHLSAETPCPVPVEIGCECVDSGVEEDGREIVVVSTDRPRGIESTDGQTRFAVTRGSSWGRDAPDRSAGPATTQPAQPTHAWMTRGLRRRQAAAFRGTTRRG